MPEMAIYTRTDGLLEPRSDFAVQWVSKQDPGHMLLMSVLENQRSSKQNRYLNGWIYGQLAKLLGDSGITLNGIPWTRDILHAAFQQQFLIKMQYEFEGKTSTIYESTASMGKKRFNEYVDHEIRPFCRELWNIEIPEPPGGFYAELLRDINK